MNFHDFSDRLKAGEVGTDQIEELLTVLYGDDEQSKQERRGRLWTDGELVKFQAVALNRQALEKAQERRAAPPEVVEAIEGLEDFADDVPEAVHDRPDLVPQIKSRVGIVQAVRSWGKPQDYIKDNRTEGVKVRCPFSHHVDNRPSAWVNTIKNTWFCGKCMVGGDVIDFYAAAKEDLQPSDFHSSVKFSQIVEEMADDLGIRVVSTVDGGFVVEADTGGWASNTVDAEDASDEPETPTETVQVAEQDDEGEVTYQEFSKPAVPASAEATEPVTLSTEDVLRGISFESSSGDDDSIEDLLDPTTIPSFDWNELELPESTFLAHWMVQAEEELKWVPIEFFLGLGFQALGMACGHRTTTSSFGLPLSGSTMVVMIGETASGKSTATNRLVDMLERVIGPKWDPLMGTGIKRITSTASAESLTSRMRTEIFDPNDPTNPIEVPTNGWYVEDEFAQLISRSRRQGGEHIKQRIMRFHDFVKRQDGPEIAAEDHSITGGYRVVHDSYFTGTFLTQNESLRTLATRNDLVSGFLNRMTFIMGKQKHPRLFTESTQVHPTPEYLNSYERVWKECNHRKRVIPFSREAGALVDSHPLKDRLEQIQELSGIFSRWQISMLRFAFLMAVNENVPSITAKHVNASYAFVSKYVIPCAAAAMGLVLSSDRSEKSELIDKMVRATEDYYNKKGEWPSVRYLKGHRAFRQADPEVRSRALDLAHKEGSLVEISLVDGPWGAGNKSIVVVPEGKFAMFYESHGKKYKYADFYSGS